ncbi:PREDICTED: LOW QUALITY PROTEIN: phosphatidylinositol 3,4,5-trisphosphate 5-phosphatase 2B-like [Nanorana parkeri]|uniref:LOW QUALITY PROTEIN: phosphatidylinositol 3,4,5-trisphosphate 5-phosphatase 2B-like n=1 Tax=Nanorana parkeri TaxID=125878 RepID=UPI0008546E0C|nr:PREDICTED: LOW QUALITY PROTEIN: phosphatidylinositol 3,4,5-trisphosphate 5-phosphatase 2B-like [Nanorana parkeri]
MCECWYHAELSQTSAEQLLIRDGRDGAFLVRQSESVPGAYAICLLYLQQVHTYRVLPDDKGLLSVQSVHGVDVRRFFGLSNLISAYRRRGNGLISALHFPVSAETASRDVQCDDDVYKCSCWKDVPFTDPNRLLKLRGVANTSHNAFLQEGGPLSAELDSECSRLDREITATWSSLRILVQLFGLMSIVHVQDNEQISAVDKLIHKVSDVLQLLSSLEKRVAKTLQDCFLSSSAALSDGSPRVPSGTGSGDKGFRRNEQQVSEGSVDFGHFGFRVAHLRSILLCKGLTLNVFQVKPGENNVPRRSAPQNLSVFIGTWNMGGAPPPRSLVSWLSAKKLKGSLDDGASCDHPDLYMIGTQENPQGDREWAEYLRAALASHTSKNYKVVSSHSFGGIKLMSLVKEEYEDLVSHVQSSSVRTGISNTLGVRGAVGVSLEFDGTSLGFVTCHLVSGTEKVQKRNQSYGEILRGLVLGDEALRGFQLPLRLTYLFWAGDLNYKLDMPVVHQRLLPVDQLNQEREKKKVFLGFREEPITFPPTSRYERGSRTYDLQKAKTSGTRIVGPTWSDRILWACYPDTDVKCTSYGCVDDIVSSDHAPVFATFEIGLNFASRRDCSYTLKFLHIESIVKTPSRSRACIEFRSLCLKECPQSNVNSAHSTEGSAFLKLGWSEQDLPEITLVAGDTFTGHLLLTIRPTDGGESFGECCVSVLPTTNSTTDHQFQVSLSQRGEETGSLRGKVRVTQYPKVNPDRSPSMINRELEKVMENTTKKSCPPASPHEPTSSRSSRRSGRRRPASICCGSYSNAEYFLFEGLSSPSTPISPRPRSALVSGEQTADRAETMFRTELGRKPTSPHCMRNTSKPGRTDVMSPM